MRERCGILRVVLWYDGPYAKYRRAGEHLHALYDGIRVFVKNQPYEVVPELDADGWQVGRFHVLREPPADWSLWFGDFVQNLRASLDHSIASLSTASKERIEYPIKLQRDQYLGPIDSRNPGSRSHRDIDLAGIDDPYMAIVDASQPYLRGNIKAARKDPLAILAWLSNADKHRLIHPAFHRQAGQPRIIVSRGRLSDIRIRHIPRNQPVGDGTEVYRWKPIPGKEMDVDVNVHVLFTVAFSESALDYVDIEDLWHYAMRPIAAFRAISEGRKAILDTTWPPLRTGRSARPWDRPEPRRRERPFG